MPSTPNAEKPRDIRDSWLFRGAILVAVLSVALLYTRGCQEESRPISSDEAVELARAEVSFTPDRYQVRFLQQGIPPRAYWGVSFVEDGPNGRAVRNEVYLVDAKTGDVQPA
jgi:hypothetical protein